MKNIIRRRKAVLCAEVSKTTTQGLSVIKSSLAWAFSFLFWLSVPMVCDLWCWIPEVTVFLIVDVPCCISLSLYHSSFSLLFIFFIPTSFKMLRDVLGNTLKISHVNMRELYIRNEGYLANYVLHFKILKSGEKKVVTAI